MSKKNIPYTIILAAHAGEDQALQYILRHYKSQIDYCSRRVLHDDYGNRYEYVDQDIRQNIETVLVQQIIMKFDPTAMPSEK